MLSLSKHIQSSMKFYYIYILLCEGDTYYTGMTNDLERRVMPI